jgi:Raf kinase inhibitor-like YbhB/YbcL family protein
MGSRISTATKGAVAALAVFAAGMGHDAMAAEQERGFMELTIGSPSFEQMAPIPVQYTCDGADVSPPLSWQGIPEGTQSLALIVDDPDAPDPAAPRMTWVHWVLYNIPPATAELPEDGSHKLPAGVKEGRNDWKRTGYGGPCPPVGRHRYYFKLYALDTILADLGQPNKAELEAAMQEHILQQAELIGTYQRQKR